MMNNRRKQEGCPIHGTHWLCRDNDHILCMAPGCQFKIKAQRLDDRTIRTLKDCKSEF
jgi:hypothetical protein